nr:MAG TPA_asm: hypothetical protein [Bacteriophage sp.]
MNHSYKLEDMTGGRGFRIRYTFEDKTPKGERLVVDLVKCENPGGARSLPNLWEKHGYIDRILNTWVGVNVYVTSEDGTCRGDYNPQESGIGHKINFDWILEDTKENRARIIAEICRRAFEEVNN